MFLNQSLPITIFSAAIIPIAGPASLAHPALTPEAEVARRRREAIKVVDDLVERFIVVVLFDC